MNILSTASLEQMLYEPFNRILFVENRNDYGDSLLLHLEKQKIVGFKNTQLHYPNGNTFQ
jgi:hypothetical protein